ncbi:phage protease [Sphingomonas sp. AOB5]|uniref:phage protease n=1 Tax=Sphingomonas sp. AOB5 TaxID=3034017 RepID=UPI0023F7A3C8|nr:phage protease [Sphingomonas sp. AOB5]MDF7776878.1 phage protease [Sphingomonas sp. AOB5]
MGGVPDQFELVAAGASSAADRLVDAVAASAEISLVDGKAPTRFMLIPLGAITLRDGRGPYRIRDKAHAAEIVAATANFYGSADMPGDYDHQTLAADPIHGKGGRAPASAWVKPANLTVEDDGIYANDVRWTPAAAAAIEGLEYRYISPLFSARKPAQGGDVVRLRNFALVGTGAIRDLPELIAAGVTEEDQMDLTEIAAAAGLGADADVPAIVAAIAKLKASASIVTIAAAAGLAATATVEEVAAAVTTLKAGAAPDLSGYVPASVVEPMRDQLKKLNGERLDNIVDDLVAAGVVIPAKRQSTRDWYEENEVAATAFFKDMPPIIAPGAQLEGHRPGEKITVLSTDQVAAAAAAGMSNDEYLVALNEENE